MAKKQDVMGGLSGLLGAPIPAPKPTAAAPQEPARGTTTRVCYNLNAELVRKAKVIAAYDRKNINEVYNEALQAYIESWTPTDQEPPKL